MEFILVTEALIYVNATVLIQRKIMLSCQAPDDAIKQFSESVSQQKYPISSFAKSSVAIEYTDCTSAEG